MTAELTLSELLVDSVISVQRAKGREKYGKGLDHADGHDWTQEALQELADAVQYLAAENLAVKERLAAVTDHRDHLLREIQRMNDLGNMP